MSASGPDLGIPGIASGLDTQSLINKIMAFESQPLALLNSQIAAIHSQEAAWDPLRALFQSLQDAAVKLTTDSGWNPQKASVSDATVLDASVTGNATPGTYTIQADQAYLTTFGLTDPMARAEQDVSTTTSITDPNAKLGYTGTFTLNGGTAVTLDGSEGLNQIAAKINDTTAKTHVTASVMQVYDSATNTTHQALQLQSTRTGKANAIVYGDSTTSGAGTSLFVGLGILATSGSTAAQASAVKQVAQDAHIVVNGVAMVADSNVVTTAIPGVTLTLKNLQQTSQVSVTLTPDQDAVVANVQKFVDAFNKLISTVKDDTKYDLDTKQGGPLLGNLDILLGEGRLSSDVQTVVSGAGTFQTLAQVGITQKQDGTLKFDQTAFRDAWNKDSASVQSLFQLSGSGVAQLVNTETHRWLDAKGILDTSKSSWDARVKDLQDQIKTMSDFLQKREDMLRQQFLAMEDAMNKMKGQAQSLTALIASLSATSQTSGKA